MKPLLAITQGDVTGIGPETIVGAWRESAMHKLCRAVVVGHPEVLQRAVDLLETGAIVFRGKWPVVREIVSSPKIIPCLPCGSDDALAAKPATIDARGGQVAYDALVMAARLALEKQV